MFPFLFCFSTAIPNYLLICLDPTLLLIKTHVECFHQGIKMQTKIVVNVLKAEIGL